MRPEKKERERPNLSVLDKLSIFFPFQTNDFIAK